MGDLHTHRVNETLPFGIIGTDFMDPVLVNIERSRVEHYICIFNCLATRAVRLEVVPAVDCDSFLQRRRFSVGDGSRG